MTPRALQIGLLLGALFLGGLTATGCGSDKEGEPLPSQSVQALENQLASVQRRFAAGGGAFRDMLEGPDNNVDLVRKTLDGLPRDVDSDVRSSLRQSFDRLWELADSQCDTSKNEQTTPTPQPTPTVPTETQTETSTTDTQTEPQKPKKPGKDENGPADSGQGGATAPEGD